MWTSIWDGWLANMTTSSGVRLEPMKCWPDIGLAGKLKKQKKLFKKIKTHPLQKLYEK